MPCGFHIFRFSTFWAPSQPTPNRRPPDQSKSNPWAVSRHHGRLALSLGCVDDVWCAWAGGDGLWEPCGRSTTWLALEAYEAWPCRPVGASTVGEATQVDNEVSGWWGDGFLYPIWSLDVDSAL